MHNQAERTYSLTLLLKDRPEDVDARCRRIGRLEALSMLVEPPRWLTVNEENRLLAWIVLS